MTNTTPKFPDIKVSLNHRGTDPTHTLSSVLAALDHNKVEVATVNVFLDEILEVVTDTPVSTHAMRVAEVCSKWVSLTD